MPVLPARPVLPLAVRIHFNIIGQFVIDNVRDTLHINPSRSNIRCDQQLQTLVAKLSHYFISLLLREIAVQAHQYHILRA
jgi:hypothetical protein